MSNANPRAISRRRIVKSGLALAGAQIAGPFVLSARAAQAIKIGLDNPLTGPYAGLGKNELTGCQMALDEINAKDGILGRPGRARRRRFRQAATPGLRCSRRAS